MQGQDNSGVNDYLIEKIIFFVFCLISLVSDIYIVLKFNKIEKNYRSYFSKVLVCLSLTNLLWSITQMSSIIASWAKGPSFEPGYKQKWMYVFLCNLQGFAFCLYFVSTFTLMVMLINSIYESCVQEQALEKNKPIAPTKFKFVFRTVCSMVWAGLPILTGSFDVTNAFYPEDCFIVYYQPGRHSSFSFIAGTFERVVILLIPFPAVIFYYLYTLRQVRKKVKNIQNNEVLLVSKVFISQEDRQYFLKIIYLFPTVLIFCWILLYICRLMETLNVKFMQENDFLFRISYILLSLEGFFNALVYTMDFRYVFNNKKRQTCDWPQQEHGSYSLQENQHIPNNDKKNAK